MIARGAYRSVGDRLSGLPAPQLLVALSVCAAVVAFVAALVFAELTESILGNGDATSIDQKVRRWVLAHRSDGLTDVLQPATHLADPIVVAAITLIVTTILIRQRRRWLGGFMIVTALGTALLTQVIKAIVDRPRPVVSDRLVPVTGAAFPSGHAAQSVACYLAIALIIAWTSRSTGKAGAAGMIAVSVAALVGVSRIYLGVHWTSDVVAGWALGVTWLTATSAALAAWSSIRHLNEPAGHPPAPAGEH